LGLPEDRATVVFFGGSLGARRINQAAVGLEAEWQNRGDRSIYHIVGRRDWEQCRSTAGPPQAQPRDTEPRRAVVRVPYEERMDVVYSAADLVVCRAGAMTVAELAAAGVPSVLVPLPGAPGDHQTANARVLERAGAAVLLPDGECEPAAVGRLIDGLLADADGLSSMEKAAAGLGYPEAAAAGAAVVERYARAATGSRR
jgi:UDP-N-acetylglucosamine--N-acetylmuramyl-(pentapeptide) pyrophosphoryl-undecaprenol N-acetylglucosamine transferase